MQAVVIRQKEVPQILQPACAISPPLQTGISTVHRDGGSGNEPGVVTAQKSNDGGDFKVLADAVHGVQFAVVLLFCFWEQGRVDQAGTHSVHPDAAAGIGGAG